MQEYTSKLTALKQVSATFKHFDFADTAVLDYGCGRGLSKDYCVKTFSNCSAYNFDPYWHFDEIGEFEKDLNSNKIIACNNVLNVIKGDLKSAILNGIYSIATENNVRKIIFKIYERDGTGIGIQTGKDKYQRNQKTAEYIPDIEDVFREYITSRKGCYIILEKT